MGWKRREKHISGLLASKKGDIESSKRPQSSKRKLGFFLKTLWSGKAKEEPHLRVTFDHKTGF